MISMAIWGAEKAWKALVGPCNLFQRHWQVDASAAALSQAPAGGQPARPLPAVGRGPPALPIQH